MLQVRERQHRNGGFRATARHALLPAAVTAVALAFSLPGIPDAKYNADERQWIYQGEQAWRHLRAGKLDAPYWTEYGLLWGWPSPPVAKYAIGIALQAAGKESPQREGTTQAIRTRFEYPVDVLAAARTSSAVFGAMGVLAFFLVARRVGGERVALLASLLLAAAPVWLASSRRALVDIHAVALTMVALHLFIAARERLSARGPLRSWLVRFAATGVALGLAVGAKLNAAGAAVGLGALLLLDLARSSGARARTLVAGSTLAVCAVGAFVAANPYLHHEPWTRFVAILEAWEGVVDSRVEGATGLFRDAYRPGLASVREAVSALVLPGRVALPWLLLPLAGAALARTAAGRRDPASVRAGLWLLLWPAAVAAAFSFGHLVHPWIGWVGIVGWTTGAAARLRPASADPSRARAGAAVAAAAIGAAAFVLATTYVTWPRYYLPVLPALTLAAALGLDSLGGLAARAGGWPAALPVGASVVLGVLTVTAAYPDVGFAKVAWLLSADAPGWGRWMLIGSIAAFCLFPVPFALARRRDATGRR